VLCKAGSRRFESRRLHFFGQCANLGCDEPVGRQDFGPAVDSQLFDQQPEEGFRLLRVGFGDQGFELVGERSRERRAVYEAYSKAADSPYIGS
jgi:hypothetical protein